MIFVFTTLARLSVLRSRSRLFLLCRRLDVFVTSIPEDVLPVAEEEADGGHDHAEDDCHDPEDHV